MSLQKNRTFQQPAIIGNYRIIGKLGKGGMGDIFKAMQQPLNRLVALKVLPPQLSRDEEFAKRFEIEARAISFLEHQNIVSIYEYGEDDGYRFIAMQFIDGVDLGDYIYENRALSVPEIIDFSKQICRGLRYAHQRNVIHRDIKPHNVLLDKNKIIHITDFGIAKIFSNDSITMTGSTVGTPEYMSPEQAQGKTIDAQSDIYSLGILMYEMLTGRPPFAANNSMAVAYKQVHEAPVNPSTKRKNTPRQLEMIIMKALKKEKYERYLSAKEMLNDLDKVDPADVPDRKTDSAAQPGAGLSRTGAKTVTVRNRRIAERRGGERRYGWDGYWKMMLRTQWLSWLAIGTLATAFIMHVMKS